jgi:hypothetical protein
MPMAYTLDRTAENLVHALCELIVLKERLALDPNCAEAVILHDLAEDLAAGLGRHCGLTESTSGGHDPLAKFVWDVQRCTQTWKLARIFRRTPGLERLLMAPYFSQGDLQREAQEE